MIDLHLFMHTVSVDEKLNISIIIILCGVNENNLNKSITFIRLFPNRVFLPPPLSIRCTKYFTLILALHNTLIWPNLQITFLLFIFNHFYYCVYCKIVIFSYVVVILVGKPHDTLRGLLIET